MVSSVPWELPSPLIHRSHNISVSQASLVSNASDNGTRHLALIFFDVLVLDSTSLLSIPYESRRSLLESLIRTTPGYAMLAERHAISLNGPHGIPGAAEQLRSLWATNIADCEEGLVLKAADGFYNHYRSPWVKVHSLSTAFRNAEMNFLSSSLRRITFRATEIRSIW